MAEPLKVGIIANTSKEESLRIAPVVKELLESKGVDTAYEAETGKCVHAPALSLDELSSQSDLLVVLGGDGTLLRAAHDLGEGVTPLLGINTGHLGFLTVSSVANLSETLEVIAQRRFEITDRAVITMRVFREPGTEPDEYPAINEVTIARGTTSRLVHLEARIDGKFLTNYSADGLIVATPTGSTAYNLSAGGPIVCPESGVLVVTPICPHTLTNRSLVICDTSTIEVRVCRSEEEVSLNADGYEIGPLTEAGWVEIRKADYTIPLAMLPEQDFYGVIRDKLRWNGSNLINM